MKINVDTKSILYPGSVRVINMMNEDKFTIWMIAAHSGIIGDDRMKNNGGQDYTKVSYLLSGALNCQYLRTDNVIGKCLSFKEGK